MGLTRVRVAISNPIKPGLEEYVDLMVDTGAILPWILRRVLENIGVKPLSKKVFKTVDSKHIVRSTSFARIK